MGELNSIFNRLNIGDQMKLNSYINREVNKKIMLANTELEKAASEKEEILRKLNDKTWERIETFLHMAMRELHVSEERIKKIDARVLELSNQLDEEKILLGEEVKSEHKILEDADFQNIMYILLDSNCKNCKKHSNGCEIYKIFKKYNIPYSGEKRKCKYSYNHN